MMKDLNNARGILWDLDNTLYAASAAIYDSFNLAVAKAALACGVDMTLENAKKIAAESYARHRYSGMIFIEEYDIPFADLHGLIDRYMDHGMIAPCSETEKMFAKTCHDHALITHAGRPWALKVLDHIGLRPWFPEERVFAYENYAFESKARSRKSFEMALSVLNRNPEETMMVEDTLENLRIPHEMGMTTVFIHHGQTPCDLPEFVDYHCDNARALLERIYSSASGCTPQSLDSM